MTHGLRLLWMLGLAALLPAEPIEEPVKQLVARLLNAGMDRSVSISFWNLSGLSAADAAEVREAMEGALAKAGIAVSAGQPELRFTLSENLRGLLLVAQFGDKLAIAPWTRTAPSKTQPRLTVTLTPVYEQEAPILDFVVSESTLMVLEPGRVVLLERSPNGGWMSRASTPLTLPRPMPRDARGRLAGTPAGFQASVPGSLCTGSFVPSSQITCKADASWATGRNYFEHERGPYFSSALVARGLLLAHLDRQARLWSDAAEPLMIIEEWGSDIARLDGCAEGEYVLATSATAKYEDDRLKAFRIGGDQALAVSDPVSLPGPVTALWTADTPREVSLTVRSRKTGFYEAARVAIGCAQ